MVFELDLVAVDHYVRAAVAQEQASAVVQRAAECLDNEDASSVRRNKICHARPNLEYAA